MNEKPQGPAESSITIASISRQNIHDTNKCHGPFLVDSILVLSSDVGAIRYSTTPVTPYEKVYPGNEVDYASYIDAADQNVFLAYLSDRIAGEVIVRHWWNGFGYIEDLSVNDRFRRRGLGRMLVKRAIRWAKDSQLPGLMLETQNNNVAACLLYESCGFEIGGFDNLLYSALHPGTQEVAVYFYMQFPHPE
jgi:streptothricin acetyltransferase